MQPCARSPQHSLCLTVLAQANSSTRVLADGETELVRSYCARRTKSAAAKPPVKPFTLYQREVYEEIKADCGAGATTYEVKRAVGENWRALDAEDKMPYVVRAHEQNKDARQRMASADPAQLLVRHEMCGSN